MDINLEKIKGLKILLDSPLENDIELLSEYELLNIREKMVIVCYIIDNHCYLIDDKKKDFKNNVKIIKFMRNPVFKEAEKKFLKIIKNNGLTSPISSDLQKEYYEISDASEKLSLILTKRVKLKIN